MEEVIVIVPVDTAQVGLNTVITGAVNTFTIMSMLTVVAHCPAAGVKIYVVVAVLFKAGDQDPIIPFVEVVGNGANAAPEHMGATAANVGVTFGVTVTVSVVAVAHCPAAGVNV